MRKSNYDKSPFVAVPGGASDCSVGWDAVARRILDSVHRLTPRRKIVLVETYPGVNEAEILRELGDRLSPTRRFSADDALLSPAEVDRLVSPFLGDDAVFGFLGGLILPQFFDQEKLARSRHEIAAASEGLILIVGCGARLLAAGDILIYADLARWEAQLRFRRSECGNLGAGNRTTSAATKYKRAFFADWRVCDRWKRPLLPVADFMLDTHIPGKPKFVSADSFRRGLAQAIGQPFRVVPFFDPAPWGGQWMKEVCDLDRSAPNYGWCFDGVPEENSLLLGFGDERFEIPSINLVFLHPRELLGEKVHARFGDEFPIRFDFLDTMEGGNLSFQVHPLTEFIQHRYGMHYTQDESYYLLDAAPDAAVYLGLEEAVDPAAMQRDLESAQRGGAAFPVERYCRKWQARKHDHFLIPAGTVHCSGKGAMILEISATPYIFTFKMWDWGRLGLDGKPRPIHLPEGVANIAWDRTPEWTRNHLVNQFKALGEGPGWREEATGLHEREFIETRRHWFTGVVKHDTAGSVNVLNLVEGRECVVESPTGEFAPFVIHYAETFIVPAAVGPYTIRPHGTEQGPCATMKAFVR